MTDDARKDIGKRPFSMKDGPEVTHRFSIKGPKPKPAENPCWVSPCDAGFRWFFIGAGGPILYSCRAHWPEGVTEPDDDAWKLQGGPPLGEVLDDLKVESVPCDTDDALEALKAGAILIPSPVQVARDRAFQAKLQDLVISGVGQEKGEITIESDPEMAQAIKDGVATPILMEDHLFGLPGTVEGEGSGRVADPFQAAGAPEKPMFHSSILDGHCTRTPRRDLKASDFWHTPKESDYSLGVDISESVATLALKRPCKICGTPCIDILVLGEALKPPFCRKPKCHEWELNEAFYRDVGHVWKLSRWQRFKAWLAGRWWWPW